MGLRPRKCLFPGSFPGGCCSCHKHSSISHLPKGANYVAYPLICPAFAWICQRSSFDYAGKSLCFALAHTNQRKTDVIVRTISFLIRRHHHLMGTLHETRLFATKATGGSSVKRHTWRKTVHAPLVWSMEIPSVSRLFVCAQTFACHFAPLLASSRVSIKYEDIWVFRFSFCYRKAIETRLARLCVKLIELTAAAAVVDQTTSFPTLAAARASTFTEQTAACLMHQ